MTYTRETSLKQDSARIAGWRPLYDSLREAIISHRLSPGTKLPEDELASIYSVSRTIVRAALQALAHDRLVQLKPNRGAFIAEPSKKEAREIFEARALIEPKVAALAAAAAKPADIVRLRQHLEREHEALHAGRDADAIALSARFHVDIAEIADHSILTGFVRDLVSRSSLIIALYWRRRDTTCERHAHQALCDALAKGAESDAAALMKSHIVDLLSGLDLGREKKETSRLADVLAIDKP
ncbi:MULTISPECIES: GntR family transcriptional regulator [unclassified Chelatococcus]|jgi:DNA-binding GntR family transcriptional regulator|uniref:GntR family transcriptional regulator n=1 Tax=unclassified Chelatococcus TaxID=2638111 RepID=UPI001BD06B02|nr:MULTISPECIES: GntR family transcriptional regulator [unclassified Chelatococcus]CAH1650453.1 DNA-binding GntR family transcriptional regulator [Hyphomicrobiales bacterium]MBS7739734.1 GntR family transcriptional regulator [Chelatococcus sp. HY11]MBX3544103.1 GntR family transcriptional regulator [Chelatococcus sp.]MCO5075730.1 GntR family transcriptional regulator [Chelatococcus sp.]CAH1666301.1 DNA-binding GntR family transcriptional regulator [Hyphomicrobiales bacterium]